MKTLILVDLQNDFIPGGALAVPEGDQVIPIANEVQQHFHLIVATQDWHPVDHGSFAANHPGKVPGDIIELDGLQQILWPVHCVQGTPGADFVAGLERSRWERVFQKGVDSEIDSYSGFFDNGYRKSTGLTDYLKNHRVSEIFLLGLATDYCVKFTALDAIAQGFKANIIREGCRGVNLRPHDVENAILDMREAGANIVSAVDLPRLLKNHPQPTPKAAFHE